MSRSIADYKKRFNTDFLKSKNLIEELIKLGENIPDKIKTRQEFQDSFETFDQKANQLFNILSTVLKTMKEMENSIIRNIN